MNVTKKQEQRRREWLSDVLQDACGDGKRDVIEACGKLQKLHPSQWDGHPAYVIAKAHVIDCNPLNN